MTAFAVAEHAKFLRKDGIYSLRQMLRGAERDFFTFMRERFLFDDRSGNLVPKAESLQRGLFVVRPVNGTTGGREHVQALVTARGVAVISHAMGKPVDLFSADLSSGDARPLAPRIVSSVH